MHEMTRIMLLMVGLLHLSLGLASDVPETDVSAAVLHSLLASRQDLTYAGFPEQDGLVTKISPAESSVQFRFQDSSALGRIRKLRSLSLLTLAETERSRLFLGLNKRGLFGLHFGYSPGNQSDRSLELARMPYLKTPAPAQPHPDQ